MGFLFREQVGKALAVKNSLRKLLFGIVLLVSVLGYSRRFLKYVTALVALLRYYLRRLALADY